MKASSNSTPGIRRATPERAMRAAMKPIEIVASAPIERRAIIIGSVNVIASATVAYAGQDERMMRPARVATSSQAARPTITPRMFLPMTSSPI